MARAILAALFFDGPIVKVLTLSPLARSGTDVSADQQYPPCTVQTAGHCRRMGKAVEIDRDG
jgi:hypothetical protein